MKRPSLSARDRRALRLGAAVMAPALFVLLVARPYVHALRDAREDVAVQRASLERELGALRDAPRDARLAAEGRRALGDEGSRLFDGGDVVAASAELAGYVADQADEGGLSIDESETRGDADGGAVAAVEIRASGDVLAIVAFLRALEDGPRLARVERLTIAPAPDDAGDGALVLTATITGLTRRAGAAPADARLAAATPEMGR